MYGCCSAITTKGVALVRPSLNRLTITAVEGLLLLAAALAWRFLPRPDARRTATLDLPFSVNSGADVLSAPDHKNSPSRLRFRPLNRLTLGFRPTALRFSFDLLALRARRKRQPMGAEGALQGPRHRKLSLFARSRKSRPTNLSQRARISSRRSEPARRRRNHSPRPRRRSRGRDRALVRHVRVVGTAGGLRLLLRRRASWPSTSTQPRRALRLFTESHGASVPDRRSVRASRARSGPTERTRVSASETSASARSADCLGRAAYGCEPGEAAATGGIVRQRHVSRQKPRRARSRAPLPAHGEPCVHHRMDAARGRLCAVGSWAAADGGGERRGAGSAAAAEAEWAAVAVGAGSGRRAGGCWTGQTRRRRRGSSSEARLPPVLPPEPAPTGVGFVVPNVARVRVSRARRFRRPCGAARESRRPGVRLRTPGLIRRRALSSGPRRRMLGRRACIAATARGDAGHDEPGAGTVATLVPIPDPPTAAPAVAPHEERASEAGSGTAPRSFERGAPGRAGARSRTAQSLHSREVGPQALARSDSSLPSLQARRACPPLVAGRVPPSSCFRRSAGRGKTVSTVRRPRRRHFAISAYERPFRLAHDERGALVEGRNRTRERISVAVGTSRVLVVAAARVVELDLSAGGAPGRGSVGGGRCGRS